MRQFHQLLVTVLFVFLCTPLAAQTTHVVTSSDDDGANTLRQAIRDAGNGDTIILDGVSRIELTSGILANGTARGMVWAYSDEYGEWDWFPGLVPALSLNNLTIDGGDGVILTGGGRIFHINDMASPLEIQITLKNLTFYNNTFNPNDYTPIWAFERNFGNHSLTINSENLVFDSNSSIINTQGNALIINNTGTLIFSNNSAPIMSSYVTIGNNVMFVNNSNANIVSAISTTYLTLGDGATFIGNSSGGAFSGGLGGAIRTTSAAIGNFATFSHNSLTGTDPQYGDGGGGVMLCGGWVEPVNIGTHSTFTHNSSAGAAGAILFGTSSLSFGNSALFSGNSARGTYYEYIDENLGGGAIYVLGTASFSSNTLFTENLAAFNGGAIVMERGTINLNATSAPIAFSGVSLPRMAYLGIFFLGR